MHRWIIIVCVFLAGMGEGSTKSTNVDCKSEMEIMKCITLATQASNQGQLVFPDTQQKLTDYCKQLLSAMDCAKNIVEDCVSEEEKQIYHNLTRGIKGMNAALCTPGSSLNTKFLNHVNCYKSLSDRFRVCSDRYIGNIVVVQKLTQEEQMKMTCCTVHEYDRCMRNAVEGRCEEEAQQLVEETVVRALKESFSYCKQLDGNPTSNCLKSFSASKGHATGTLEDNGCDLHQSSFLLILLLFLFSTLIGS